MNKEIRKIDEHKICNMIKRLSVKTVTPKYLFLFYDKPSPFAEVAHVDSHGMVSNYKPASILLLRNCINSINEFMGNSHDKNFSGLIPKNVIYFKTYPSSLIIYYEYFKNVKLQFSDKSYTFKDMHVLFFVTENKIMAYRINRYNDENTILYRLRLPNVFDTYICTGDTNYRFTNYDTFEEVIKKTNDFFLNTKFSDKLNIKIKEYYRETPKKGDRVCLLKEMLEKYIL